MIPHTLSLCLSHLTFFPSIFKKRRDTFSIRPHHSDDTINSNSGCIYIYIYSVNGGEASWKEERHRHGGGGRGWCREESAGGRHERKRKENVGERERKDSVRPGVWVEARAGTRTDAAGVSGQRDGRTGTGTRERRNTSRLDVDGGVGVGPDMAEASRLPEVAKEMKCLPAGEAAPYTPGEFLPLPPPPPPPSHRNRRSSPGFPEFSSLSTRRGKRRTGKGKGRRQRPGKGAARKIASNLRQV